jgi:tRNA nucleotidyltransferase (CCA-adding enzyme)
MLEDSGQESWAVGGCVRDAALGTPPHDWDLTTSALPEQMIAIFAGHSLNLAGVKHGTVGVLLDGEMLEITTYRVDGAYTDARHPDGVSFTRSLREDLARRDFTINAMALHPEKGLCDPFGGLADLQAGRLRAVGTADNRMREDALRILRGLRFLSRLGFAADPETEAAFRQNAPLLLEISAERIAAELTGMLTGAHIRAVLLDYPDVLGVVLPEILPCVGFDQRTPYHLYDIWEHTARAVEAVPPEPLLRWVMLLHDLGKPERFTVDANGVGHFKGHAVSSAEKAEEILRRLKLPHRLADPALPLIRWHDLNLPPERKTLLKWMAKLGSDQMLRLWQIKRADNLAQNRAVSDRLPEIAQLEQLTRELIAEKPPLRVTDLAVNGQDLLRLGLPPGPEIGRTLHRLLEMVLDGDAENDRKTLLEIVRTTQLDPDQP